MPFEKFPPDKGQLDFSDVSLKTIQYLSLNN